MLTLWMITIFASAFALLLMACSLAITYQTVLMGIDAFTKKKDSAHPVITILLKNFDYLLIAITIFVISMLLCAVIYKMWPSRYHYRDDHTLGSIVSDFKKAIGSIDKLILSMLCIALSISFLVYILTISTNSNAHNININVLYFGLSVGIIIATISIFLRFTHEPQKDNLTTLDESA